MDLHTFEQLVRDYPVVAIIAVALFIWWVIPRKKQGNHECNHRKNIRQARKLLKEFRKWKGDGVEARITAYLRKISPYVFEELLLCSFDDMGYRITRNQRYSGDGGTDGSLRYRGRQYLVQAKRYASHIRAEDVADFKEVIKQKKADGGYFCHTGRTGKGSHIHAGDNIIVVSGSALIDLLLGKAVKVQL